MVTVRQPGSTIEWFLPREQDKLPEERTIFVLKVLTWDEWKAYVRRMESLTRTSGAVEVLEWTRKALGVALVDVRNLKILKPDGSEMDFLLEKKGEEISAGSMAVLMPFKDELVMAIQTASQFGVNDAKNLQ